MKRWEDEPSATNDLETLRREFRERLYGAGGGKLMSTKATTTTDGRPAEEADLSIDHKTGQQRDYIVLSAEERAKGFVRPVRRSYTHTRCGTVTTMGRALAETYAREPHFYGATFCCGCGAHFPVGENGEFLWEDSDEKVGT